MQKRFEVLECDILKMNTTFSSIRRVNYARGWMPREQNKNSLLNLQNNEHNGKLSSKSKSKIQTKIDWLWYISKIKRTRNERNNGFYYWKLNFITLTLPSEQRGTDQECKRNLLMPFLQKLRRKHRLVNFIWRAEKQKNGRIHFHLATDIFVHWKEVRDEWNFICALQGYETITINGNPANSTDIHSVRDVENIKGYASKYLAKNASDELKVEGRLWGCSKSLEVLEAPQVELDSTANEALEEVTSRMKTKIFRSKWVSIIYKPLNFWLRESEYFTNRIRSYIRERWNLLIEKTKEKIKPKEKLCETLLTCSNLAQNLRLTWSQLQLEFTI